MNARERRKQRRLDERRQGGRVPIGGIHTFANRIAETMAGEAREVKRIPKLKRLAMLLGFSSALVGCAAKATPARRQFATPEHTSIRLKERCPLTPEGHLDKHCVLMVRIDATEVGE